MAILENVSTEAEDILSIKTDIPIVGLIALSQFVDTTEGEITTDYFRKEFKYSVNGGLTFSSWIELTTLNIAEVDISKFDAFVIEYRYTRVGTTPDVTLTFDDILVSGVVGDLPYPVYLKSSFTNFFTVNDLNVFGWALNVLEKLYTKGLILPDYVNRGDNQSNLEDEDFITYWNSITHFFAIIVYFARQFHDFQTNPILLEQFLKSKDLTLPTDDTTVGLQYLYDNYIAEYQKRGTASILDQSANGADVDGELIRIVKHSVCEELVFALFQNYESGWCIGKSSPLWKGTEGIVNLIKGYEFTSKVVSLTNYPLLQSSYISIISDKMIITNTPNNITSGIGGTTKKIIIDPLRDYEISFRVTQSAAQSDLVFGCLAWNKDSQVVSLQNIESGANTDYFFFQQKLNLINRTYWVRGVIYNKDTTSSPNKTTLGIGNNLRFSGTEAYIVPIIAVKGTGTNDVVKIDNIKIRPMKLNFSRGQLGIHNLIYLMTRNNNGELTDEQTETFIKENLLPYNSFLKTDWL